MATRWEMEAARLAVLARLALSEEELGSLASACAAIETSFSDLATYAAALPPAGEREGGELRADVAQDAPVDEVEGILRAVPSVDPVTRAVRVPRGLP